MKKQNFNELTSVQGTQVTNRKAVNDTAKGARTELRSMSIMYYVNQLNKLARKNEYVNGVNIRALGLMLKNVTQERDLFTARCFTPDVFGRPCTIAAYKGEISPCELLHGDVVTDKGNELRLTESGDSIVVYKPVPLSLTGLVSSYRAILAPYAAAQDKEVREANKEARKAANQARKAARAALKEEQTNARIAYNNGRMSLEDFARVMSKTA